MTNQSNWLFQITQKPNCASIQLFVPLNHTMDSASPYWLNASTNASLKPFNIHIKLHFAY